MKPLTMGAVRIDRVAEIDHLMVDANWLFPNISVEQLARNADWLSPRVCDPRTHRLGMSFHSYLLRLPGLTMLVDTCNGNHKNRPNALWQNQIQTDYLGRLALLGVEPEDVDLVLCTHLHTDHVGWNTKLADDRWVPTFPNARYLASRADYDHFRVLHEAGPEQPVNHGSFLDSVLPVVAAGQFDFVRSDYVVRDGPEGRIWLAPAPGHTPGHVAIHVEAGGQTAVLSGDILHHPIQFEEPDLASLADYDPGMAVQTRLKLCESCAERGALLLTGHFPAPTVGRVSRHGSKFRFRFLWEE